MDKFYTLMEQYPNWRYSCSMEDFFKEHGKLTYEEVEEHNKLVAENHDFIRDIIKKLNEFDPENLTAEQLEIIEEVSYACQDMCEKDFMAIVF